MLVHICCSVDSHFFLQKLRLLYPNKVLIGFFYNPNIHPPKEYQLRLLDVKRSSKKFGIKVIEGEYDYKRWLKATKGLENEPEKGDRCSVCFYYRLEATAKKAIELGIKEITTTLFTSPKKSITQLKVHALNIETRYPLHVVTPNFRVNGGTQEQANMSKKNMLYHQNYCGCIFALERQRDSQNRLKDELMSPITLQVLPSSIQERVTLFKKIEKFERKKRKFTLKREKFLNYRLLRAFVRKGKEKIIPSYILFYSSMKKEFIRGKIESIKNGIGYFNREEVLFIDLKKLNSLSNKNYNNISDLMKKPLKIDEELQVREKLSYSKMISQNSIIVIDELEQDNYEILIKSKTYIDIREILIKNWVI